MTLSLSPIPTSDYWPLADYAMTDAASRGRHYPEEPHPHRGAFQRDRERLIHCAAFRRLVGKTQVLAGPANDHHRNRLTHTLEVAQISRAIARRLRLNEDLCEAIALSHDLGHPPYGHAGEAVLDDCLRPWGGFEHNLHALRIVEELEQRYPEFPGLNLTFEVREAMAVHSPRGDRPELHDLRSAGAPLLEAQLVDAADSLAYNAHDLDDALGAHLLNDDDLRDVGFWQQARDRVHQRYGSLSHDLARSAIIREFIDWSIDDLVHESEARLERYRIRSLNDVRQADMPLIGWGSVVGELKSELETFLLQRVYRQSRVLRLAEKGRLFLRALFDEYVRSPELLPVRHLRRLRYIESSGQPGGRQRVVGDYLAGMTERFVQQEYVRLFQPALDL